MELANIWQRAIEQGRYLLKGPGSNTSSTQLVTIPPPTPPLRTSLVFESHIQEAGKGSGRNPQTISSAWDERRNWGDDSARTWQGLTPQERKLIMLDIYLNNPWVSACIDVIAKRIFSGGYVVEKIDEEAPDNKQHEDLMHEFALRINPDWDFNQLGRALIVDELIFGESYGELTWKGGLPWQLFKVDCIPMGYRANRYGQIEQFYQEMESTRERIPLDPNNIIRWWFPHPRASIDPFAPSEKVSDAVVLDKKMTTWMNTFFQKGTKFPFSVEGVGDMEEADRFLTFFRQNFTGEKNAHAPFVTWGNAKLVPLAAQKLDMDFQQGLDRMRTIVFAAFGVPPAAVSIIESGNIGGGTGEDQDKSLIFNACDPTKSTFFEKLNDRIVKRGMGITDYRYSARYAEYRSDESIAKVQDIRAKNGTRSIDELRQEDGKRPYKAGGSVPFIWSTKEIVPVPRLDDMEDEQRATAQVTLDTAKAGADLAQTKAKQAKEPPPEPVQPPALLPPGQKQQPGQAKQSAKPAQKQKPAPQEKQQEAVQLSLLDAANESQGNTGVMIALMIPSDVAQQIAIAGGEPVEDLHITLGYLGDMADLDSERIGYLKSALKYFAASRQPLAGRIAGLGRFDGPEEEPSPVIALPDIPGLPAFRQQLITVLAACETPAHQNHGYTPHITLAYIDVAVSMPITSLPHLNLYFDAICLCVGDERTYFPLLGQKQEDYNPITHTWEPDDTDQQLAQLRAQGVTHIKWDADPGACDMCIENDGQTVEIGKPFKNGQRLVIGHPNCNCKPVYIHGAQEQEDKDATQKLPVVKVKKVVLTENDTWEGRL